MKEPEPKETEQKIDVRVQATATIWAMAVGMMVFSVPLSQITESAVIPLAVIAGSAIGTFAVWRPGTKKEGSSTKEQVAAQQRIAELEERLANLETINNFERRLAEEALKRHDASALGQVMPDEQSEMATTANSPQAQRAGT
jgi:hypothetical protein